MIRWLSGRCWRLVGWWQVEGQFSRPVLLVSPRRRRVHLEVESWFAEHGYAERLARRLAERIALVDEEELFRRIFGPDDAAAGAGPDGL